MTTIEQRNRALVALKRMGVGTNEIAEVVGMTPGAVSLVTKDIQPRKLHCCQPPTQETVAVGRQFGHNAEVPVSITRTKL